jgi:hypothetical protein
LKNIRNIYVIIPSHFECSGFRKEQKYCGSLREGSHNVSKGFPVVATRPSSMNSLDLH